MIYRQMHSNLSKMCQHGLRCKGSLLLSEVHNDEIRDLSGSDTVGLNVGKHMESWHF